MVLASFKLSASAVIVAVIVSVGILFIAVPNSYTSSVPSTVVYTSAVYGEPIVISDNFPFSVSISAPVLTIFNEVECSP